MDAHHRLRQAAIELAVPLDVGPEPGRHAGDDDLERAANRVAGFLGRVDERDHFLLQGRVHAAQRRVFIDRLRVLEGHAARFRKGHVADGRHVAGDADAEAPEKLARERSGGHA